MELYIGKMMNEMICIGFQSSIAVGFNRRIEGMILFLALATLISYMFNSYMEGLQNPQLF